MLAFRRIPLYGKARLLPPVTIIRLVLLGRLAGTKPSRKSTHPGFCDPTNTNRDLVLGVAHFATLGRKTHRPTIFPQHASTDAGVSHNESEIP